MGHKEGEQVKFGVGQAHGLTVDAHRAGQQVQFDAFVAQDGLGRLQDGSQPGVDPGFQLSQRERVLDAVRGADVERAHPVGDLTGPGQGDHGQHGPLLGEGLEQRQSSGRLGGEVQDRHVCGLGQHAGQSAVIDGRGAHGEARGGQPAVDQRGGHRVIGDDHDLSDGLASQSGPLTAPAGKRAVSMVT